MIGYWLRERTTSRLLGRLHAHPRCRGHAVHSAVLEGEAILLRPDNTTNFDGLRSRQGQAEAILIAYDIMEADGQDVRPEPLEERRKRVAKLLSHSSKALREAITEDGGTIFRHACGLGLEGIVPRSASARGT